jgi:hypothetical protein
VFIRLARGQHVQQQHENEAERQEQQREMEKLFCEVSELFKDGFDSESRSRLRRAGRRVNRRVNEIVMSGRHRLEYGLGR